VLLIRALRRPLILCALVAALGGAHASVAAAETFVPAKSARAFGDSVGVNVRLNYLDTSYGDFETVQARLRELGVRHVSDSICPGCDWQIERLQRLARLGIRANLGVGWLSGGTPTIAPALQALRTELRESVVSISGINEPDISGDPSWVHNTRLFHIELNRQVQADPLLRGLPVVGPSLVHRESRPALGDLSGHVDRGNIHPYPGGLPPMGHLEDERQMMAGVTGDKPLVATEVGYHTDMAHVGPHRPASERAVATYTPRIVLEAFRFGIERTYLYTLADLWSDAEAQARQFPKSENSFGLLRFDLSPKPSFIALRNLLRAVDADSPPVPSPGGLRFDLEGAGADVRRLLLRSADGSYALVLWRDVSVWDRAALRDLSPAADRVDVVLGQPLATARRFDPVASAAETQRWTSPSRLSVELRGEPVVLRLVPPGAGAKRMVETGLAGATCAASLGRTSRATRRRARARCCRAAAAKRRADRPSRRAKRKRPRARRTVTWAPARCTAQRRR
jgi:hypothetical protein